MIGLLTASAAEKPIVYLSITGERGTLDDKAHELFTAKFDIMELKDRADYARPQVKAGNLPAVAKLENGKPLGGEAQVMYVVNENGLAVEHQFIKCSDDRLKPFILATMKDWRFETAKLKGETVPIIAAQNFNFQVTPTEFVTQLLEPTGGKIQRPNDWHYLESHQSPSYTWIMSREKADKEPYTTGFRIQMLVGVKEVTGKSAKEFLDAFIAKKEKTADRVVSRCDPTDQGLFSRVCLETEEGPFHITYSLFWGNKNMDIAVITIAGTTHELWETYTPVFNKMNEFELVDMKRFKK